MPNITIELTDEQYRALAYVVYDPNDWVKNAVFSRIDLAEKEIIDKEIKSKLERGETFIGDVKSLILNSTLPSAKEVQDNIVALQNKRLIGKL